MKYSAEERQSKLSMINQWQASKLSKKEFCRQHKISFHYFQYWHAIAQGNPKYKSLKKHPVFLQLPTAPVSQGVTKQIELIYPKGHRLILYYPIELSQLRQLMK